MNRKQQPVKRPVEKPRLRMEEAWQALEMAGVADDVRNMPMGMHTLISEGSGGISGGQRQRLFCRAGGKAENLVYLRYFHPASV